MANDSKLSEEDRKAIVIGYLEEGKTQGQLAEEYHVNNSTISNSIKRYCRRCSKELHYVVGRGGTAEKAGKTFGLTAEQIKKFAEYGEGRK